MPVIRLSLGIPFHIVEEEELRQLVERSLSETGLDRGFRLQCLRSISDRNLLG
jgi:hypothetical protein